MTTIDDALAALLAERDAVTERLDTIARAIDALRPLTPAGAQTSACSPLPAEPAGDEWGCDQCAYVGASARALRIHAARKHGPQEPTGPFDPSEQGRFTCDHCGREFNRRSNRDRHRRKVHGETRKPGAPKVTAPTAIPVGARPKPVEFDGPKVDDVELGPMRRTPFDPDAVRARAAEAM